MFASFFDIALLYFDRWVFLLFIIQLHNDWLLDRKKKTAKENEDEHKENKEWRGQKRSRNTCGAISTHDREDYEENIVKVEEAAQSKCEVGSAYTSIRIVTRGM